MIKKKSSSRKITIDLTGPEGNAFCLIGYAKRWGRNLGFSNEKIEEIISDMMSSDYENLVKILDSNFGKYVTFLR